MAKVNPRLWKIPGQRTKRKAWGFTVRVGGKRVKHYRAEWTKNDAEAELAKVLLNVEPPKPVSAGITFGVAVEHYLASKSRKRTLDGDRKMLEHLKTAFGEETPLAELTAARISAYKAERLNCTSERTKRPLKAAGINSPLALLRHLLRVAHQEWEVLPPSLPSDWRRSLRDASGGWSPTRKGGCWPPAGRTVPNTSRPSSRWPWRPGCGRAKFSA